MSWVIVTFLAGSITVVGSTGTPNGSTGTLLATIGNVTVCLSTLSNLDVDVKSRPRLSEADRKTTRLDNSTANYYYYYRRKKILPVCL